MTSCRRCSCACSPCCPGFAAIHDAIAALPDTLRLPLVLHALEGLTHREVADLLDLTEGTCKRRVFEARTALRAVLGDGRGT